jgi:predicted lipoprotein with Yx(FWY)xxD motif
MFLLGAALVGSLAACGSGSGQHPAATQPPASPTQAAAQHPVAVKVAESSLGPILTDQDGRTLYAFTKDKDGNSTCTGQCIATWPALASAGAVTAATGADKALLSQTTRGEGTTQATYGNWPLYYYVGDAGPGDVDGQGVDDVWFVIGADGKLVKTAP